MKKWNIQNPSPFTSENTEDLVALLLVNRGITTAKEKEAFLHPKLEEVTPKQVGIDNKQLKKTLARITKAIEKKEQIVVFGDYDVDGITGTAILWETLHSMGANVTPYIPHRIDEGYGLSIPGITNVTSQFVETSLIITVDNGIVAHDAVTFANQQGIDVIITDHHTSDEKVPEAYSIVHTTNLCGAGVAYLLSKELTHPNPPLSGREHTSSSPDKGRLGGVSDTHLELATLGTVADLVPLTGANRAIVKYGLEKVCKSKRPGLQELYKQAGIVKDAFEVYEIGYVIAPRLNAAGRIESAMDSLRLLCTTNRERAQMLAEQLELTNKDRQQLMKQATQHAILGVQTQASKIKNILFVAHESYLPGVIGLVAGKLVEEFYRPAIVIALGEKQSKASVRSIKGFNIIEFLRSHSSHFINVGGHPMAAGFTVETAKVTVLQEALETSAEQLLNESDFVRNLPIDTELPFPMITKQLYKAIKQLAPFGMGNPEPVFATKDVTIANFRIIGKEGNHLRLNLQQGKKEFEAIAFGMGELAKDMKIGDHIDLAYTIDENTWNGNTKLQLKVRDLIQVSNL